MDPSDYLPLSMLNQLEYCARRFYLMYVCGEMEINAAVLDGIQRHERAHTAGAETRGEWTAYRRVYLWSDRLRIAGYADVVEEQAGGLTPVEYKRGKLGRWLNDHVQLCAQALCLEERVGRPGAIAQGYIFYFGSRRRQAVALTAELRACTEAAVAKAFELAKGELPAASSSPRCRDCSLEPVCLPFETEVLTGRAAPRRRAAGKRASEEEERDGDGVCDRAEITGQKRRGGAAGRDPGR